MKRYLERIVVCLFSRVGLEGFGKIKGIFGENGCEVVELRDEHAVQRELEEEREFTLWVTDDVDLANVLCDSKQAVLFFLGEESSAPLGQVTYCIEGFEDVDFAYFDQIYCRCKHLPWIVLETDRLLVREQTVEDVDVLYDLYAEPSITKYMENLYTKREQEYEYTREYIRNVYGFYGYGIWIVIEKTSGKIIGRAGLESKEGFAGLEIGFMIGVPYQGKGYATEVCRAILAYGSEVLEIQDYRALIMDTNTISIKLIKKLGFHENGKLIDNQIEYNAYYLAIK